MTLKDRASRPPGATASGRGKRYSLSGQRRADGFQLWFDMICIDGFADFAAVLAAATQAGDDTSITDDANNSDLSTRAFERR